MSYLSTFHDDYCWMCGSTPCQGAHIRHGHEGGTGLKPPDNLVIPLCRRCHEYQEAERTNFWALLVVKELARRRHDLHDHGVLEEFKTLLAGPLMENA